MLGGATRGGLYPTRVGAVGRGDRAGRDGWGWLEPGAWGRLVVGGIDVWRNTRGPWKYRRSHCVFRVRSLGCRSWFIGRVYGVEGFCFFDAGFFEEAVAD